MEIAKLIDHTLLKADATKAQILQLCNEAKTHHFASVCINPHWIVLAKEALTGTSVKVCTVIGFPLGANSVATKVFETKDAITMGAEEIDMVMNISKAKDGDFTYIEEEVRAVVDASGDALVKVILETCLLTKEEIRLACLACVRAGADFVKTSTGFSTRGATVEDVSWMKACVGDSALIKAAGGVRTLADLEAMVQAGASRIGTSAGVVLMQGNSHSGAY
ncbi:deoxyribose-phosphate aldolase [Entomospira culicis]|uniref:Deoxyribose-phosphate aldolase n=1 Tax=Entomospira culicis TaxID=2719989 RepID=A0A968KVE4_9SPIO|nr:deoxyribose-phosphate aldolase [Entomospira culicis]NIZ19856.1 deoxyribose-phosphate aldolase [Entomospira culicis]NIZ70070.1 deoxyribose-phosphate aldolase [Entomospira culicis]WDI37174.1 deoxyribose-phosphate aldolase [Entomospira culicis]WDI38803.1 deoxyribose-phosphate aldolase [Entomospira culicis]